MKPIHKRILVSLASIFVVFLLVFFKLNYLNKIENKSNLNTYENRINTKDIPIYREEFLNIKLKEAYFRIPLKFENPTDSNFFNCFEGDFFSIKKPIVSYCPITPYLTRFQTLKKNGEKYIILEFPYNHFKGLERKYAGDFFDFYYCIFVYNCTNKKVFYILWQTILNFNANKNRRSYYYEIDVNTQKIITNLSSEIILKLFPEFIGTYENREIAGIVMLDSKKPNRLDHWLSQNDWDFYELFKIDF